MLYSAKHENCPANKSQITIFGIFIFITGEISCSAELRMKQKCCISSEPACAVRLRLRTYLIVYKIPTEVHRRLFPDFAALWHSRSLIIFFNWRILDSKVCLCESLFKHTLFKQKTMITHTYMTCTQKIRPERKHKFIWFFSYYTYIICITSRQFIISTNITYVSTMTTYNLRQPHHENTPIQFRPP